MIFTIFGFAVVSCQSRMQDNTNTRYIDPTIGNVAPLLNSNRSVVHLLNQIIRVYPVRYDHLDLQITGFPLSALNIITPQVIFSVKPSIGEISDTSWNRRLNYDQAFEITRPWYYSTLITDDEILTEYTAGEKTGIYRFTFPKDVEKNILLSHCYDTGLYEFSGSNEIWGTEFVVDAIHQQKGIAYMYGAFTGTPQSGKSPGEKDWGKYSVGTWGGAKQTRMNGEKAWVSYSEKDPSVVEFRYAISFISIEQAKENYKELEGHSFERLKQKGRSSWEKIAGQIKVEGGIKVQRRTFYTALYRCYPRMINITENGKYFSGYDKKVHEDQRPFYVDDYSWDNFLALHPLYLILNPQKEADMLQSYVRMYQESRWIPDYPKVFGDREGMFGFCSAIMFLDAYRKGIRNFDVNKAFEGMLKSAEQATMLSSRNGSGGTLEDFYNEKGYYPALYPGEAETELDKTDIAARFAPKAQNYKNLWNGKSKIFLIFRVPGDKDGGYMSAFVVFSAMGFYPVKPGIPIYTITSPVFSKVIIDLPARSLK